MRQEQFNEIINKLNTDDKFGISVYDLSNGVKAIELRKNKDDIVIKYGSVENFFNGIFSNGITEIGIQPKRRNGTNGKSVSWIDHPKFSYEKFSLQKAQPVVENQQPVQPKFTSTMPIEYTKPLAGTGLSIPEMISLHVDRNDKTRLATENEFLKRENDRLNKEVFQYKERELENKYNSDKSNKTHDLILGVLEHADKLKGFFVPNAGPQVPEIGLGNPNNLSQQQQSLINVISQSDDFTVNLITHLYNAIVTETALSADLTELLKKHNIVE